MLKEYDIDYHISDELRLMQFYSLIYFSIGHYDYDDIIAQFEARQFRDFDTSVKFVDKALIIVEEFLSDQIGDLFSIHTEELLFFPYIDEAIFEIMFTNDLSLMAERGFHFPGWMFRNERAVK